MQNVQDDPYIGVGGIGLWAGQSLSHRRTEILCLAIYTMTAETRHASTTKIRKIPLSYGDQEYTEP